MFQKSYDPYNPSLFQALMYTQFLANSFKSLGSVKNYIAGARSFLKTNNSDFSVFNHHKIKEVYKGDSRVTVREARGGAPYIEVTHLLQLSELLLSHGPLYTGERAAFLIMYSSYLRHSNVIPCPKSEDDHTVRTKDMSFDGEILWISVYSSKTIIHPQDAVSIPVYVAGGPHCAVGAWFAHLEAVPHHPDGPAFLDLKGAPFTLLKLLSFLRESLSKTSCSYPYVVTLHSFRKTGAKEAASRGASLNGVATLGTWGSRSVFDYAPKRLFTDASAVLANSLGSKK